MKPGLFCSLSKCEYFTEFAEEIYSLEFAEEPNYNLLRFLLAKNLMERDLFPNKEFDWITKIRSGRFNKLKDIKLNMFKKGKPEKVYLSKQMKD